MVRFAEPLSMSFMLNCMFSLFPRYRLYYCFYSTFLRVVSFWSLRLAGCLESACSAALPSSTDLSHEEDLPSRRCLRSVRSFYCACMTYVIGVMISSRSLLLGLSRICMMRSTEGLYFVCPYESPDLVTEKVDARLRASLSCERHSLMPSSSCKADELIVPTCSLIELYFVLFPR